MRHFLPHCSPTMQAEVLRKLEREERKKQSGQHQSRNPFEQYFNSPITYAENVLRVEWWSKQQEIARALIEHNRVFVKASHSVGKSFLAGGLVNWFFDCYKPGICLTTAPTFPQVVDVLWKEVRVQRKGRPGLQPKAPRLEDAPDHFAVGYTASTGDAFQGRHDAAVLIIFDEAVGVDTMFWDAAEGMMSSETAYWLCICNPTDTSSRAYEECQIAGKWHVMEISALDHPNIEAQLSGQPAPFPAAVSLGWVQDRVNEWCEPITFEDKRAADIEFPAGSGDWFRPGPLFESRVLGRWPSQGSIAVWSDAMWQSTLTRQEPRPTDLTVIGCDKARFGDDFTSFVVRRGNCVLHHETHNGWDNNQISGRLKQLCGQFAREGEDARKVRCLIDDVQGGVVDMAGGFSFAEVNSANRAVDEEGYPNKRSELWFTTAERANEGRVDLSRLSVNSLSLLRSQCMSPTWKVDNQGRREVERKADTKKRIKRSPDDADALNLAFSAATPTNRVVVYGGVKQQNTRRKVSEY